MQKSRAHADVKNNTLAMKYPNSSISFLPLFKYCSIAVKNMPAKVTKVNSKRRTYPRSPFQKAMQALAC
jgi:hypothetical protein